MFDYNLEDEIQGKIEEKDGIFFKIVKVELICFRSGICFLLFKTHMEETEKFSDLLNFNHKFANINLESKNLKKLEKIKIQTDSFSNISRISEIIESITGKKINSKELDIDDNMFLTYSYVCVDSNNWNKDLQRMRFDEECWMPTREQIDNTFVHLKETCKTSSCSVCYGAC